MVYQRTYLPIPRYYHAGGMIACCIYLRLPSLWGSDVRNGTLLSKCVLGSTFAIVGDLWMCRYL